MSYPFLVSKETFSLRKWTIDKECSDLYNEIIAKCAAKHNCELNDMREIYASYNINDILEEDGIHLNKDGQLILAKQVIEKITALMEP